MITSLLLFTLVGIHIATFLVAYICIEYMFRLLFHPNLYLI